jgi:hypothetical protein
MSTASLAATPIPRTEPRRVVETSPPWSIDTARAYREWVAELCALAEVSGIEGFALLAANFPGPFGLGFGRT